MRSASFLFALCLGFKGAVALRTETGKAYIHKEIHDPYSTTIATVPDTGNVPTWEWHEVAGTQCMDKRPTGFWIREGNPKKLMIYLMGGGACFNPLCDLLATSNPLGFDEGPPVTGILRLNTGAVNETKNPLGDHTVVFIPYCTGDVFLGNQSEPQTFGVLAPTPRIFMGRTVVNLVVTSLKASHYIARSLQHFVLTGESAGGFGALASYDFLRTTFFGNAGAKTHWHIAKGGRAMLIDDSGVVMNAKHLTPCLTRHWYRLFNLATTIPQDCDGCNTSLYAAYPFLQEKYSNDVMAFISTTADETISRFYAYGFTKQDSNGECGETVLPGFPLSSFKDGLEAFFNEYVIGEGVNLNNFSSYFFKGTGHTHSTQNDFYFKKAVFNDLDHKEIRLVDWYSHIVDGFAMDVESDLFETLKHAEGGQ